MADSTAAPVTLRIVRTAYRYEVNYEDGDRGSLANVDQIASKPRVVHGPFVHYGDPNQLTEHLLGLSDDRYPHGDFESDVPYEGDSEYSYTLEQLVDGTWKYVNGLIPYHVALSDDDEFWEGQDDYSDEDPEEDDSPEMGCDASHEEHSCGSDCSVCPCGEADFCALAAMDGD